MKVERLMCFLVLTIAMFSCGGNYEYVCFEEPQPIDSKSLKRIPKKFHGYYKSCTDTNEVLIIGLNRIENRVTVYTGEIIEIEGTEPTSWEPSTSGESLTGFKDGSNVFRVFDTSGVHENVINHSMFEIQEHQVIKRFKNNLFLNYKENEIWNVVKFEFKKDTLLIGQIMPNDTLLNYSFVSKETIENKEDSTSVTNYNIKPSKKEFIKLFVPNSFKKTNCYCKAKPLNLKI